MTEETLQALFESGEVLEVKCLRLGPEDTLVVRGEFAMTQENVERVYALLKRQFPDNRVLVLAENVDIGVITPD